MRPSMIPLSTRQSTAKSKSSLEFLFPEDIENLTAFLEEQEHSEPSGAKPKKSSTKPKKKDKAPSPPSQPDQSASVENLILLETLGKERPRHGTKDRGSQNGAHEIVRKLFAGRPTPSFCLWSWKQWLHLVQRQKLLCNSSPRWISFATKRKRAGTVDYDKLDLAEFVSGFLEFCKEQPESSQPSLLAHLQLLMDRAITYSSVRKFHFFSPQCHWARQTSLVRVGRDSRSCSDFLHTSGYEI